MMQRTHDLAAVSFVSSRLLVFPPVHITWETFLGLGIVTILGATIPDIDNVSSHVWKHKVFPWEGKLTRDFLQGHRQLSHSFLGGVIFTLALRFLLQIINLANIDVNLLLQGFEVAYLSHLITDSFTKQGVPWLYPLPIKFGFPPLAALRIKAGGWVEKGLIFPLLLAATIWLYYTYRSNIWLILPRS